MTSRLLTPWWRTRIGDGRDDVDGGVLATAILDWQAPAVQALLDEVREALPAGASARELLQAAHAVIVSRVRPVYGLEESQRASLTLGRGRGSCSQRLAVLEAVARAAGIATRVQGLLVDGRFWYPRFPRMRHAVPDLVLLAWPEFDIEGGWVPASELFGAVGSLCGTTGFTNADGETLFDALARTAVDWHGTANLPSCDLSAQVVRDLGRFASRDALFAQHGQTMCWPARMIAGPVLDRRSAVRR